MSGEVRSKKLKRLVTVQRHLEKMAESDLAATSRQRIEVGDQMDTVIDAIGNMDNAIHRAFSHNYSERFSRLMVKDQQLAGMQVVQENRVLRERTKGDRLEENMDEARSLEDREAADNEIYDMIELKIATQTVG